ncbi:glutathione S-transferase theta-3-like isoform X1 [Dreissena polymorpha]|uniref:Glutathione S-transferase n=1 Tax=Dreissena polymorpha TaxID=45954 RepID=A0A9D4ICR6_DREPO|nr:glutathione S-transferase theta-3-like isoform X1 [Dreissena polymorpha]KAH3769055.1 hypothetical protein DPMN_170302 [Dreissena polymorpha]
MDEENSKENGETPHSDTDDEEPIDREAAHFASKFASRRHSAMVFSSSMKAGHNGFHRRPVELYLVRIYPACRAVWFYMLQHNIPHILVDIDFSQGESQLPDVVRKQPHREVPIIVDGDFVVFDGPAILTYLATTYTHHAGYGITMQTRMLSESIVSWANSELHRAVGFNYIYPQFLDKYTLPDERANEALIEHGLKQLSHHLELLEMKYLEKSTFLTGNRITIADTYVATILLQTEWLGTKLSMWPHVEKWLSRVKNQVFWDVVHSSHTVFLRELESRALFD